MGRDFQARLIRSVFRELQKRNDEALANSDDIDVRALMLVLGPVLEDAAQRLALLPALAYYLGKGLDGDPPTSADMARWTPPSP